MHAGGTSNPPKEAGKVHLKAKSYVAAETASQPWTRLSASPEASNSVNSLKVTPVPSARATSLSRDGRLYVSSAPNIHPGRAPRSARSKCAASGTSEGGGALTRPPTRSTKRPSEDTNSTISIEDAMASTS